ncbi:hypothetical protein FOFC_02039, partial [Fusarium oxysporum]
KEKKEKQKKRKKREEQSDKPIFYCSVRSIALGTNKSHAAQTNTGMTSSLCLLTCSEHVSLAGGVFVGVLVEGISAQSPELMSGRSGLDKAEHEEGFPSRHKGAERRLSVSHQMFEACGETTTAESRRAGHCLLHCYD